jgi:hypothetical protein
LCCRISASPLEGDSFVCNNVLRCRPMGVPGVFSVRRVAGEWLLTMPVADPRLPPTVTVLVASSPGASRRSSPPTREGAAADPSVVSVVSVDFLFLLFTLFYPSIAKTRARERGL